ESAGLALVGIDGHEPRARVTAHDLPLLAGGKAGPAEAAQAGIGEDLDELLWRAPAGKAVAQQLVTAFCLVGVEVLVGGNDRMVIAGRRRYQALDGRMLDVAVADLGHRRRGATPHAR